MKNLRKISTLLLMAVMVATMLVVPGGNVQAAKKKITWRSNKKKSKTKDTRNAADVAVLQKMIKNLNAKGARVPADTKRSKYTDEEDEGYTSGYLWNKEGRLEGIIWNWCYIQGTVDLTKFPALKRLECSENQISNLNLSKNTALTYLNCTHNQLTNLNVNKNNQLTSLNVSNYKNLNTFEYDKDKVTTLIC